jgi:hypothetical protein
MITLHFKYQGIIVQSYELKNLNARNITVDMTHAAVPVLEAARDRAFEKGYEVGYADGVNSRLADVDMTKEREKEEI